MRYGVLLYCAVLLLLLLLLLLLGNQTSQRTLSPPVLGCPVLSLGPLASADAGSGPAATIFRHRDTGETVGGHRE